MNDQVTVVVLAAGKGTRMESSLPKVLHRIAGEPMIVHVLRNCSSVANEIVVVVGYEHEQVRASVESFDVSYVVQDEQLGTGHAVMVTEHHVSSEYVLVLNGDCPLVPSELLCDLVQAHMSNDAACTFIAAAMSDPTGYGRVITDNTGRFVTIIEELDADAVTRRVSIVNSGIYIFNRAALFERLHDVNPANAQGEYHLTDVVTALVDDGHAVHIMVAEDHREVLGVNTQGDLAIAESILASKRT